MINEQQEHLIARSDPFKAFIDNKQPIVDKSNLMRWLNDDSKILIFLCGEGWGSSTNLSMLRSFLSNQEQHQDDLFKGMAISGQSAYRQFQGKYPVLWLDFSKIAWDSSEQDIKEFLITTVKQLYLDFEIPLPDDLSCKNLADGVWMLIKKLYEQFGVRPVMIIDSYDRPAQIAYYGGFYNEIYSVVEKILCVCLKGNLYLSTAFLTGQARPGDQQVPTSFNNFSLYSMFDRTFEGIFGFSEEEVRVLFAAHDVKVSEETWQQLSLWYGGYYVRGKEYFNPHSVSCYLQQLKQGNLEFKPFFTNKSPFLKQLPELVVMQLGQLLKDNNQALGMKADLFSTYYPGSEKQESVMLNRLLFNQILTPVKNTDYVINRYAIEVKLPNQEMTCFIKQLLVNHYHWSETCLSKIELMAFIQKYMAENSGEPIDEILTLGALIWQGKLIEASSMVEILKAKQLDETHAQSIKESVALSPATILNNHGLGSPLHTNRNTQEQSENKDNLGITMV